MTTSKECYYQAVRIWDTDPSQNFDNIISKCIDEHASEKAQTALNNASKNIRLLRGNEQFIFGVDIDSITDPSNIQL